MRGPDRIGRPGEAGLSLLELVVAMGLFSLILLGILGFYSLGVRACQQGALRAELQQNARIALFHMDRSLRSVESFNIPGGDSGPAIEFFYAGSQRRYTYRVRFGELEYLVGTSVTKVASHVESVHFSRTPQGVIHIRIKTVAREREYLLTSAIKPRNIP